MGIRVDISKNEYRSGDDLVFQFTVDDADAETPAPKDLTGATAKWVLAQEQGGVAIVTKETPTDVEITDAASGVLEVNIAPADTGSLSGQHWHELEIIDAAGRVHTAAYGQFYIEADSANSP